MCNAAPKIISGLRDNVVIELELDATSWGSVDGDIKVYSGHGNLNEYCMKGDAQTDCTNSTKNKG